MKKAEIDEIAQFIDEQTKKELEDAKKPKQPIDDGQEPHSDTTKNA